MSGHRSTVTFRVESGKPILPIYHASSGGAPGVKRLAPRLPLADMRPPHPGSPTGDSVFIPPDVGISDEQLRSRISAFSKRKPNWAFVTRKLQTGGWRVWRVK